MNGKNGMSRITLDIPKESHKRIKALSAVIGKSMREIIVDAVNDSFKRTKIPNIKTLEAMKNVENRKGLKSYDSVEDLFKKLGI